MYILTLNAKKFHRQGSGSGSEMTRQARSGSGSEMTLQAGSGSEIIVWDPQHWSPHFILTADGKMKHILLHYCPLTFIFFIFRRGR